MPPLVLEITFLSQSLVAVAVVAFLILRGRLQDRWPGARGLLSAIGASLAIALIAAASGMIPWTGPWLLTGYAVLLIVGFIAALAIARRWALRAGIDDIHLSRIAVISLVLGMIGARARYVWENWGLFHDEQGIAWGTIFNIDRGGMVWYGGLLAAIVGDVLYARWQRLPLLPLADGCTIPVCVGLAFGRIGCFVNGCCSGRPTDLPWGVVFTSRDDLPRHPTQLYETLAAGAIAAVLWWFGRRPRKPGLTAAFFCIAYGLWRFANEALRDDYRRPGTLNDLGGFVLTNSQTTSLWLVAFGCVLATWASTRPTPAPTVVGTDSTRN